MNIAEEIKNGRKNLIGANLRGADLWRADLSVADLRGANLWRADLRGADLRGANLRGADLRGANLRGVDLSVADLRGANLRGANLRGVDLREAKICKGFTGSKETKVRQLTQVGSENGTLILMDCKEGWFVNRACFRGSVVEFLERVNEVHGDNEHGVFYRGVIKLYTGIGD